MKRYISKLATTLALVTATPGCGSFFASLGEVLDPTTRGDRDTNYAIEEGRKTKKFQGSTDYTVVLIPEHHRSYACAANVYLTIEGLVDDIKFVAREGRIGPTEHTNKDFQEHKFYDHNLKTKHYKDIVSLPFEERKELAHQWIYNRQFPSEYTFVRNWVQARPMISPVLFEAVYQGKFPTIGVENKEALEKAKTLTSPFSDADLTEEKHIKTLIHERNKHMVKMIQLYASIFEEGELIPFPIGFNHVPDLIKKFIEKDISFEAITFRACMEPEKVD